MTKSTFASVTPQVVRAENEFQLFPRRSRPCFELRHLYHRVRCLRSDAWYNSAVSKIRCCCLVTMSLLSVACVSAWTVRPYSPRMSYTTGAVQPHKAKTWIEPYRSVWKTILGAFHVERTKTWCSPLESSMDSYNEYTDAAFTQNQSELMYNGEQYLLMPIPDRGKLSTHAIHGTLFNDCCIARYDVYRKRRKSHSTTTNTARTTNATEDKSTRVTEHADVVAIVTVGSDLDGHNNIVHGGIIALVIDDVLGFGYFAVLLQEAEQQWEKNGNNSTTTDTILHDVVAVTANLNINYRAPVPSNSTIIVEATLVPNDELAETRREKNKFYWNVRVVSLDRTTTYCQGTSLYVIPKRQLLTKQKL